MSSEKFCLRWNDFERNISAAFRDIRDDKEFFDITIACEDEQLQAHKVILSACSPFFKGVLRRNQHQHPLLFLKGVSFKDMEAVLNFMYHGEVNVAQDDLNSFLQVAEDLRVKGLTQNDPVAANAVTDNTKSMNISKPEPRIEPMRPRPNEYDTGPTAKRPRANPPIPKVFPQRASQHDNDIEEIVPIVKSEPREHTPNVTANPVQPMVQEQTMAMYDEGSQQVEMGGNMMMSEHDTEQYDENYGGEYEGHYGDQSYDNGAHGETTSAAGAGEGKSKCVHCDGWFHKRSMGRHIERKHSMPISINCDLCGKTFSSNINLKEHYRRDHGISSRAKY